MSILLKEIKKVDRRTVAVLEEANLLTDSAILALTQEDLRDLFPGTKNFQLRRNLYDTIHKQPIAEQLLKKLKGFIPSDSLRAALTNNGVLVDYLQLLKDMKTQMNGQMSFINAHIDLLEEFSTDQPDSRQTDHSQEGGGLCSGPSASATGDPVGGQMKPPAASTGSYPQGALELYSGQSTSATGDPHRCTGGPGELSRFQSVGYPQRAQGSGASDVGGQMKPPAGSTGSYPQGALGSGASDVGGQRKRHAGLTGGYSQGAEAKLLYKMVVGGKTFDNHLKLMAKVEKQVSNRIQLCDDKQDYKLTFVFCPISSRIGADVEAAMADIKDNKPIILVLMHHTRAVKAVTSMKTWSDDANVELRVNVFYHETTGLLKCEENDAAVTEIKNRLLSYIQGSNYTGGNAQGVVEEVNSWNWFTKFNNRH